MQKTAFASVVLPLALTASLILSGCSKHASQTANQPQETPNAAGQAAINPNASTPAQPSQQEANGNFPPAPPEDRANGGSGTSAPPAEMTIPAGTHIRIITREDLGSKISQPGETFSATVSPSVVVQGVTLVRSGSPATGTVIDAKALGHVAGEANLALRLDTVRSDGRTYRVESSTVDRVERGKGKRTALLAGGGGGLGALIGGLAGGGKGALIGGLVGAGAGTAGGAATDNREIMIPAETPLTFRLEHSVSVSR
jgi:hypothetical protein